MQQEIPGNNVIREMIQGMRRLQHDYQHLLVIDITSCSSLVIRFIHVSSCLLQWDQPIKLYARILYCAVFNKYVRTSKCRSSCLNPICKILHCEDSQNRDIVKFVSPELSSTHFSQLWKLWLTCEDRDSFMMQHLCDMFASWLWGPTFLQHMNVMYDNLT